MPLTTSLKKEKKMMKRKQKKYQENFLRQQTSGMAAGF